MCSGDSLPSIPAGNGETGVLQPLTEGRAQNIYSGSDSTTDAHTGNNFPMRGKRESDKTEVCDFFTEPK